MFQVINGKLVCSFNAQQPVFNSVRKVSSAHQVSSKSTCSSECIQCGDQKQIQSQILMTGLKIKPTQETTQCLGFMYLDFKTNQVVYKRKTPLDLLSYRTYNQFPRKKQNDWSCAWLGGFWGRTISQGRKTFRHTLLQFSCWKWAGCLYPNAKPIYDYLATTQVTPSNSDL